MMTEHILRISLTELKTVRILCHQDGCAGVIELPIADMATRRVGLDHCPVCATEFRQSFPRGDKPGEFQNLFVQLAQVVGKINDVKAFGIEFPIALDE